MSIPARATFLNSSVISVRTQIGWNGEGGSIDFQLVDDPTVPNLFSPPVIGAPCYFTYSSFTFNGLLSKYTTDRNRNGDPLYSVKIKDPRELLEFSKIITEDYNLQTYGMNNLFNVFGYWEATGFGNSESNDTGMPWQLIQSAITTLCGGVSGPYGGPITYKGFTYTIDLSQLPPLPSYFRVAGGSRGLSILEFIQICCDAAAYDFFIKLVGFQIVLKTVPRRNAYPLGTLGTMIAGQFLNQVERSSVGIEEREDITSTFIIGGNLQTLYQPAQYNVQRFWGFDNSGYIMQGNYNQSGVYAVFMGADRTQTPPVDNYQLFSYQVNEYKLYVPEIASITGDVFWYSDDLEMMILLGLGQHRDSFTTWCHFLNRANNVLYRLIALSNEPPNISPPYKGQITPNNTVNSRGQRISDIQAANQGAIGNTGEWRKRQVYEAISKYAKDYYGKKWAVYIPGVNVKFDTDTGVPSYSHEISDGGWVDASGSIYENPPNNLLGLPSYASDLFQTPDGRYQAFALFDATAADLSKVNPTNSLVNGTNLYVKGKMADRIYFDQKQLAWGVMDIDPIYDYPDSIVGNSGIVGALYLATGIIYQGTPGNITNAGQRALSSLQRDITQGSLPLITHPMPRKPIGFEVPIKSNVDTYGPWYIQGAAGKVNYEQDNSMVPWNYSGYANLDLAANAKALLGTSQIQQIESGYIEVVGEPAYSIGDIILANGPNITNITLDFEVREGCKTTYRFETYIPRYGQLGKYNIDRMRRQSIAGTKYTQFTKQAQRLAGLNQASQNEANRTHNMINQLFDAINIRSPQNILVGKSIQEPSGNIYPVVSATTYKECFGMLTEDPDDVNNTTIGTFEQIVNPYSVNDTTNPWMPAQYKPNGMWSDPNIISSLNLQPWIDPNFDDTTPTTAYTVKYYSRGDNIYEDINDYTNDGSPASVPKRVFGMKAPLVLTGWGFDLYGVLAPTGSDYITNYPDWKTGPIDPLWDDNRKVWTVHDIKKGIANSDIPPNNTGSAFVEIFKNNTDTGEEYPAWNWLCDTVPSGSNVYLSYVADDNKWYVLNWCQSGATSPAPAPFDCPCPQSGVIEPPCLQFQFNYANGYDLGGQALPSCMMGSVEGGVPGDGGPTTTGSGTTIIATNYNDPSSHIDDYNWVLTNPDWNDLSSPICSGGFEGGSWDSLYYACSGGTASFSAGYDSCGDAILIYVCSAIGSSISSSGYPTSGYNIQWEIFPAQCCQPLTSLLDQAMAMQVFGTDNCITTNNGTMLFNTNSCCQQSTIPSGCSPLNLFSAFSDGYLTQGIGCSLIQPPNLCATLNADYWEIPDPYGNFVPPLTYPTYHEFSGTIAGTNIMSMGIPTLVEGTDNLYISSTFNFVKFYDNRFIPYVLSTGPGVEMDVGLIMTCSSSGSYPTDASGYIAFSDVGSAEGSLPPTYFPGTITTNPFSFSGTCTGVVSELAIDGGITFSSGVATLIITEGDCGSTTPPSTSGLLSVSTSETFLWDTMGGVSTSGTFLWDSMSGINVNGTFLWDVSGASGVSTVSTSETFLWAVDNIAGSGASPMFYDTFDDVIGTDLNIHTPNQGLDSVVQYGDFAINNSNILAASLTESYFGHSAIAYNATTTTFANSILVDFKFQDTGDMVFAGLGYNANSSPTCILVQAGLDGNIYLYSIIDGAGTLLDSSFFEGLGNFNINIDYLLLLSVDANGNVNASVNNISLSGVVSPSSFSDTKVLFGLANPNYGFPQMSIENVNVWQNNQSSTWTVELGTVNGLTNPSTFADSGSYPWLGSNAVTAISPWASPGYFEAWAAQNMGISTGSSSVTFQYETDGVSLAAAWDGSTSAGVLAEVYTGNLWLADSSVVIQVVGLTLTAGSIYTLRLNLAGGTATATITDDVGLQTASGPYGGASGTWWGVAFVTNSAGVPTSNITATTLP